MNLSKLLMSQKRIRVIGFDDAHWKGQGSGDEVHVAGIVCSDTRFEGMLWNTVKRDGTDGTEGLVRMLAESKFAAQVQVILIDGITLGGCNVVDLQELFRELKIPVIAVMRKLPNLERFRYVVEQLPDPEVRWQKVLAAGPIHELNGFVFQVVGEDPEVASRVLARLTDQGKVPEALRVAHLIGSAVKLGTSGKRA